VRAGGRGGGGADPRAGAARGDRSHARAPRRRARRGPVLGAGQADPGAGHRARPERDEPARRRPDHARPAAGRPRRPDGADRHANRDHEGDGPALAVRGGGLALREPAAFAPRGLACAGATGGPVAAAATTAGVTATTATAGVAGARAGVAAATA